MLRIPAIAPGLGLDAVGFLFRSTYTLSCRTIVHHSQLTIMNYSSRIWEHKLTTGLSQNKVPRGFRWFDASRSV